MIIPPLPAMMRTTHTITLPELQGAGCYLLHYTEPYMGRPSRPCQHYLGWARCLGGRITLHAQGRGAHFTKAVYAAGIAFEVAAIWPGATRRDERALKRRHHHAQICPLCRNPANAANAAASADPKGCVR